MIVCCVSHLSLLWIVLLISFGVLQADDRVFSGPQVGEKLPMLKVRGVFDDDAGKELDIIERANGRPVVIIFIHDVTRPSVSLTRVLSQYTMKRAQEGLSTGVVLLSDDATEAENTLVKMRHALTPNTPTGVSLDGREGPGSYGLNRNVMMTILVGNQGKVAGNFALVQPSLQADLPKILESIVAVAGGKVPKLEELEGMPEMMRKGKTETSTLNLRPILAPLIRRDATKENVDQAALEIEELAAKDAAARQEIGRIANTIIDGGKLANYGTEPAQTYLRKWAKEYGPKPDGASTSKPQEGERR